MGLFTELSSTYPRLAATVNSARGRLLQGLSHAGYEREHWSRIEQQKAWQNFLHTIGHQAMDCAEISPGTRSWIRSIGWRSYTPLAYPEFNICAGPADRTYDIVIADQIWEHLRYPYRAARNVHAMLKPDGWFVVGTPFMLRLHPEPGDYTRWSPDGLKQFVVEAGFPEDRIVIGSWGNRRCVKASLDRWPRLGWRRHLRNEWDVPVVVWAFAQRSS